MEKAPEILVNGVRAAAVDKKRAALYIGCPQLIEKMLWATRHNQYDEPWLEIVHNFDGNPKSKTLISTVGGHPKCTTSGHLKVHHFWA